MRFMTIVKAAETQGPPPESLMHAIGAHAQQELQHGRMIDMGGLYPTSAGTRVRLSGGKVTVLDGPFTEAKEVVGGYAIFELPSREEAIEAARRFMELHREHWPDFEGETEVRQIASNG